jgi:shikimate kinase
VKQARKHNLILVGMMGAGKTTVGRMLARRLKREFFDSDEVIERRCGVRIPVIFDIEGEGGFRARERLVVAELCALDAAVIATGGGAVLAEENRRALAGGGTVIYLHARPGFLWQRVRNDRNRPLLATPDPQKKLEEIYAVRDPLYREVADIVVDTGRQSVQTLSKDLLAQLEAECRLSA